MKYTPFTLTSILFILCNFINASEECDRSVAITTFEINFTDQETGKKIHRKTKSSILLGKNTLAQKDSLPDGLQQDTGTLFFHIPSDTSVQNSRTIAYTIHQLCQDQANMPEAEKLFVNMSQHTEEERLHRCIAAVYIAEAYMADIDNNGDKAYRYFLNAAESHRCTGSMYELCKLSVFQNKRNIEGIYWIQRAQEIGLEMDVTNLIAYARKKCSRTIAGKEALEEWEAACKIRGLHYPEEGLLTKEKTQ